MESHYKVRGGGTITAAAFKQRNAQVRLPPRKRAHAPHPRACRMRVAIAHPSVCGMTPVGADFLKITLKVLHGLEITLAAKHSCDPSSSPDPENRTNSVHLQ